MQSQSLVIARVRPRIESIEYLPLEHLYLFAVVHVGVGALLV